MKRKQRSHPSLEKLFAGSLILPLLYRFALFFYQKMRDSAVGRFFCGYEKENAAVTTGWLDALRHRLDPSHRFLRPLRFAVARQFDNSTLLRQCERIGAHLAGLPLVTYGLTALFFSLFSGISFAIQYAFSVAAKNTPPAITSLIVAAALLLVGICLVASGSTLADALRKSRLTSFLLFRICGANEEYFRTLPKTQGKILLPALIGSTLGLLTLLISPTYILLGLVGLILALLIYKIPEAGVTAVLFAAPLLPTMVLVVVMMYLLLCFFIKYLRGKRVIRMEWIDITVLCFSTVFFFAGFVSADPASSVFPTLVYLCFIGGYFLVVNLIRSTKWVGRCYLAVLSSAVLVALYGVYQNFFTTADTTWQDTQMFSDIAGRVVSTLENPNVLAEYLIMILPLAVAGFFTAKSVSARLLYLFAGGILGACLIFTWSRGAWLGILLAMVLFMLIYSKKTLVVGFFGILAIPFLPFVLPQSILNRFMSIGNLGDTSTSYRVHIWEGTVSMLRDHFLGGIGIGGEVFSMVYPKYALSGIENAPHSHNLYLQILVETGILGLILFLVFLIVFVRHNLTFCTKPLPAAPRTFNAALFCGILAVLAQGMTDYVWYNYRVFLMFWLLIGLTVATARATESEARSILRGSDSRNTYAASLDISISALTTDPIKGAADLLPEDTRELHPTQTP